MLMLWCFVIVEAPESIKNIPLQTVYYTDIFRKFESQKAGLPRINPQKVGHRMAQKLKKAERLATLS
jgi:hypothetical protein